MYLGSVGKGVPSEAQRRFLMLSELDNTGALIFECEFGRRLY